MQRMLARKRKAQRQGRLLAFNLSCLLLVFLFFSIPAVKGQAEGQILIQPPDTAAFPILSFQFKLQQLPGAFLPELSVDQLRVFENEEPVQILALTQEKVGINFTLVINGGYDFALRDDQGVSRYEKMKSILFNWASNRSPAPKDTWSFVTHEGTIARNEPSIETWLDKFESYETDFRSKEPDLASLENAIDLAKNRVVGFGVDKAMLYISLPPKPEQIESLKQLTIEAQEAGIRVSVWMVGDPYFLTNDQGGTLAALASETGGEFTVYPAENDIPNPESGLSSLGTIYTVKYESGIRETGTYPLRIEAALPQITLHGEGNPFYLQVCPPKPILLSPPCVVTRTLSSGDGENPDSLLPLDQELKYMIEFPDGYERDIIASRLYVDGREVAEHTAPPFEAFVWDLADLTEPGEHTIQVEVEDVLGLSSRTIDTPVQLNIVLPEAKPQMSGKQIGLIIASVFLVLALALLIFWGVKRFLRAPASQGLKTYVSRFREQTETRTSLTVNHEGNVQALLIPLGVTDQGWRHGVIQITQQGVSIGHDTVKSDLVLDSQGNDEIQAQFYFHKGDFWLQDLGSTPNTWVNYDRIGTGPVKIHTGDLVHFGDFGFRFTETALESSKAVSVTKYEPLL